MEKQDYNSALNGEVENLIILVFRTSISNLGSSMLVCRELERLSGVYDVNVDLDDWEKILRIECDSSVRASAIEKRIGKLGYTCAELN